MDSGKNGGPNLALVQELSGNGSVGAWHQWVKLRVPKGQAVGWCHCA